MLNKSLFFVLVFSLVNGLVFIFIVPPWEHYDEPSHFEYAWLIANRYRLPEIGDYDLDMRLEVGESLVKTRFFDGHDLPPINLADPAQPFWIFYSQIEDPPLFYILAAIPIRIFRGMSIEVQLYAGRIISLIFLLLTVYAAFWLTSELYPDHHPLRWGVPLFIAMLPGFVEFMTALNDYSAAIGFTSLWLLSAIRLIKYKWSLKQAIIVLILTCACIFSQKAVMHIALFVPFIFLFSRLPNGKRWIGLIAFVTTIILVVLIAFEWKDAALWLRRNNQDFPSRVLLNQNSGFKYAVQGKVYPDQLWGGAPPTWHAGFFQLIPLEISEQLKGKQITLGAWIWADQEIQGYGPGINSLIEFQDNWYGFQPVTLSTKPQFVSSVIELPKDVGRLQIWLRTTAKEAPDTRIYFTGIVLTQGMKSGDNTPILNDDGSEGIWSGKPFTNLVRNSQAMMPWPYLRPEIARMLIGKAGINPTTISSFIALIGDFPGTKWYIRTTTEQIFRTFWATFSWGQVKLYKTDPYPHPYLILLILTIIGIISGAIAIYKIYKYYPEEMFLLISLMVFTIGVAFLYGVYTMGGALRFRAYIPVARYIFPAIVPMSLILVTGWYEVTRQIANVLKLSTKWLGKGGFLFLLLLNVYSIFSIIKYFEN